MEKLFNYAIDIGKQMLISGAEVHRVEESISRMCHAIGAVRVDVFIITSSIVVAFTRMLHKATNRNDKKANRAN